MSDAAFYGFLLAVMFLLFGHPIIALIVFLLAIL